jgi:hypothetical protein
MNILKRDYRCLRRELNKLTQDYTTLKNTVKPKSKFRDFQKLVLSFDYSNTNFNNYMINDNHVKVYSNTIDILCEMLKDPDLKEVYFRAPWFSNSDVIKSLFAFCENGGRCEIRTCRPDLGKTYEHNWKMLEYKHPNFKCNFTDSKRVGKFTNINHTKNYLFRYEDGQTISSTGSTNISKGATFNIEELIFTSDSDIFESDKNQYFS